ncbi:MAG: cobyrinate a,c-diamide synthase [Actinomycetes bacterium]
MSGPRPVPRAVPRVVVAAPASGHGKTTVATGLIAALRARGLAVSPHKVGPDYIDPGYLGLAAGRPGRNLDPFLVGTERIVPLFLYGTTTPRPADVAVVEGVMGLYDGATGHGELASTAQVARLLDAPVLLVVDAAAQGRSVAALVTGFRAFDPAVRLGGVVLNRVGSTRHETILRTALDEVGVPVLGVLPRDEALTTPARHLGLVPVAERTEQAQTTVDALGCLVAAHVDLAGVLALAATAGPLDGPVWDPAAELGVPVAGRPRVALATGAAFSFGYPETAELLAAAGAEVVTFDPLTDPGLPERTVGLVIGGGFPEVYADALAANTTLTRQVAGFTGPVAAECAGLLYLGRSLEGRAMCGRLPTRAAMAPTLTVGYRQAVVERDSLLVRTGERFAGHEFHRTTCAPTDRPVWSWPVEEPGVVTPRVVEGYADDRVHASYLHLHWAGSPMVARRLVAACVGTTA